MRIGTRGSALAIAQAESVAALIDEPTELVTTTTLGDRGQALQDKSRWVSALELALLEERIDIAVHSAKDVPTQIDARLELVAIPARADPRDALCGAASLDELRAGARVGTSSLRRTAQLRAAREDIEVVELRGNVDTRLGKLAEGEVDALVLALAGLVRLQRASAATGTLDGFVPAAGQGALAVQARMGTIDPEVLRAIIDGPSTDCVNAERALVHALGASCHTPVGAHAVALGGGEVRLRAWVGLPDGSAWLADEVRAPAALAGGECATRMVAAGAAELLSRAEREAAT
jgi:hydroxymethylbilane synthase